MHFGNCTHAVREAEACSPVFGSHSGCGRSKDCCYVLKSRYPEKERSVASIQGRACRTSNGPKHCRVHLVDWQVPVVQRMHEFDRDSLSLQPYPRHTQSFADNLLGVPAYDLRWGVTRYYSFMLHTSGPAERAHLSVSRLGYAPTSLRTAGFGARQHDTPRARRSCILRRIH